MIEEGILPEDTGVELLDPARVHLQTQQPILIRGAGEPEPDAAIVLRPLTAPGKPRAEHVSCVIEVSGTSLERDRTTKLRHYARGGIPQYIILTLQDRAAEEYLIPDPESGTYATRIVHTAGRTFRLQLGRDESIEIPLAQLLPPS